MRPELFDQAGFGVSLCLQRRFGYTFVFFLSELTGRLWYCRLTALLKEDSDS